MYMQSYHNVTLAYGDSKTEQPDRAVPFSPAFALCDECMLSCVRRFKRHSLILQCCVCCMYMKQTMVACDRADQGTSMGQFHSALAVRIWYACFS